MRQNTTNAHPSRFIFWLTAGMLLLVFGLLVGEDVYIDSWTHDEGEVAALLHEESFLVAGVESCRHHRYGNPCLVRTSDDRVAKVEVSQLPTQAMDKGDRLAQRIELYPREVVMSLCRNDKCQVVWNTSRRSACTTDSCSNLSDDAEAGKVWRGFSFTAAP